MVATSKAGLDLLTKQRYLPNANSGGLHQRRYLTETEMTERMYRIPATGSGHEMKPSRSVIGEYVTQRLDNFVPWSQIRPLTDDVETAGITWLTELNKREAMDGER